MKYGLVNVEKYISRHFYNNSKIEFKTWHKVSFVSFYFFSAFGLG